MPTDLDRRTLLSAAAGLTAAGLFLPNRGFAASPSSPVASTAYGRVRGYLDQGVKVFKGLPYGADTATRRFQPALKPQAWAGVREATTYGPASPQTRAGEPIGEDCLRLNVWTPATDARRRPVMVYIHGGEYSHGSGSAPLYDGVRLSRRGDVVVVTVNHRLSAFGHLYLGRLGGPAYASSGNVGVLDLVLALEWVRDNISNFGGDPACVTVFGQSGGGAKIATLMALPAAKGLFHRAITMSGQQVTASGPLGATQRARAYLDALKLTPERLNELETLPLERLVEAIETADPTIAKSSIYFGPVRDDAALPRHPFYPDAPPQSADVPMIIGNTHDETRFFLSDPKLLSLTWDELPGRLGPEMRVDVAPETIVAEYRRLYPQASPTRIFYAATTAGRSWRAAVIEAELRAAQGAPAWVYQLDWGAPLAGGRWAPHTLDIPLAFDNIARPGSLTGVSAEAQAMADQVSETFLAFARTGDPNNAAVPHWPGYELPHRATLVFDTVSRVVDDPRGDERRLFAGVPFVQRGTF